jgi:hypothetical protein
MFELIDFFKRNQKYICIETFIFKEILCEVPTCIRKIFLAKKMRQLS